MVDKEVQTFRVSKRMKKKIMYLMKKLDLDKSKVIILALERLHSDYKIGKINDLPHKLGKQKHAVYSKDRRTNLNNNPFYSEENWQRLTGDKK